MENKLCFENRAECLANFKRFNDPKHRFKTMFYRTNLLIHTRRVEAITESLIPIAQQCFIGFDPMRARLISRYHDDHELVNKFGDVSLQLKLQMGFEEKEKLIIEEEKSINKICKLYPKKVEGYYLKEILMHSLYKDCIEAQLHSFADKHDGFGESIHDLLAGNIVFLEPVFNYQQETFSKRFEKFPLIVDIFDKGLSNQSGFLQFAPANLFDFFANGSKPARPHTPLSIYTNSGFSYYESWKEITLKKIPGALLLLTKQKEFYL